LSQAPLPPTRQRERHHQHQLPAPGRPNRTRSPQGPAATDKSGPPPATRPELTKKPSITHKQIKQERVTRRTTLKQLFPSFPHSDKIFWNVLYEKFLAYRDPILFLTGSQERVVSGRKCMSRIGFISVNRDDHRRAESKRDFLRRVD
jgi:hypothetical protein